MRWLAVCALVLVGGCGGSRDAVFGDAEWSPDGSAPQDAAPAPRDGATPPRADAAAVPAPSVSASCTPDAGAPEDADPAVKRVVAGTNGTFSDACDARGNLVKQVCATATICGTGPNPPCTTSMTGAVSPLEVDCAGLCAEGACASSCPVIGDQLTITATDGNGQISYENVRDRRHYQCKVTFQTLGAYDCTKAPYVGGTQWVVGTGLHGSWCTGADFGNIGIGSPAEPSREACAVACNVAP